MAAVCGGRKCRTEILFDRRSPVVRSKLLNPSDRCVAGTVSGECHFRETRERSSGTAATEKATAVFGKDFTKAETI